MSLQIHDEVTSALRQRRPVVALESAVTTCGLPRRPPEQPWTDPPPGWNEHDAVNLQAALGMERAARDAGAVPATVAVLEGVLRVGLSDAELRRLAGDELAGKAAARDLAYRMISRSTAGTTVSATLACSTLPRSRGLPPIRIMATGGIGGVHRGWTTRPDISSDLTQLARTQVCVVCSGIKAQLDAPATVEALETLGVPVIGFGADQLPRFYSTGDDARQSMLVPQRLDDPAQIAELCRRHWDTLGMPGGVVVAQPPPAEHALPMPELEQAIATAEAMADRVGIRGPARTPYVLAALADLTSGRSLRVNVALLVRNTSLAARIAAAMLTA